MDDLMRELELGKLGNETASRLHMQLGIIFVTNALLSIV